MNSPCQNRSESREGGFVFVGDADNLSHLDDHTRGYIDVPAFVRLLRSRGVSDAVMVGNWFSPMEAKLWLGAGVACVETKKNADDAIVRVLRERAEAGVSRVLLGSGDGRAFSSVVAELEAVGVHVHVLSNRRRLSRDLQDAASGYAYSDAFVHWHADEIRSAA